MVQQIGEYQTNINNRKKEEYDSMMEQIEHDMLNTEEDTMMTDHGYFMIKS